VTVSMVGEPVAMVTLGAANSALPAALDRGRMSETVPGRGFQPGAGERSVQASFGTGASGGVVRLRVMRRRVGDLMGELAAAMRHSDGPAGMQLVRRGRDEAESGSP